MIIFTILWAGPNPPSETYRGPDDNHMLHVVNFHHILVAALFDIVVMERIRLT